MTADYRRRPTRSGYERAVKLLNEVDPMRYDMSLRDPAASTASVAEQACLSPSGP